MPLKIIGAGVGRTGTYSLKLAIEQLGLGRCHHMEEVLYNQPVQVPLWAAAAQGHPDWAAIFKGYDNAVDWPTAGFVRQLSAAYPSAKFILTERNPESWVESFSDTIYKALAGGVPPPMQAWFDMACKVITNTGFPPGLDIAGLRRAFDDHNEMVKASIPANRLLVYQVKEGWGPLCRFLAVPEPMEPFPRTNNREEFWDRLAGKD